MLAADEAEALGLVDEGAACVAAELKFEKHPVTDFGLPEPDSFGALVGRINACLAAGEGVAVHCRAGIGRSGMVTSGVLVAQGLKSDAVMKKVAQARGISIPDTVEQGNFVAAFAEWFCTKR